MILSDLELGGAGQKIELILYIREIADPLFHAKWLDDRVGDQMIAIIDFLFGDMDILEGRYDYPAKMWLEEDEIEALRNLACRIDDVRHALLPTPDAKGFVSHPAWKEIVDLAQQCLRRLLRRGNVFTVH